MTPLDVIIERLSRLTSPQNITQDALRDLDWHLHNVYICWKSTAVQLGNAAPVWIQRVRTSKAWRACLHLSLCLHLISLSPLGDHFFPGAPRLPLSVEIVFNVPCYASLPYFQDVYNWELTVWYSSASYKPLSEGSSLLILTCLKLSQMAQKSMVVGEGLRVLFELNRADGIVYLGILFSKDMAKVFRRIGGWRFGDGWFRREQMQSMVWIGLGLGTSVRALPKEV